MRAFIIERRNLNYGGAIMGAQTQAGKRSIGSENVKPLQALDL